MVALRGFFSVLNVLRLQPILFHIYDMKLWMNTY
jgi:hypothetical protein